MKILDFTSDSVVLDNTLGVEVRHIPYGKKILPGPEGGSRDRAKFSVIVQALCQNRIKSYDWVIFPPVYVNWQVANRPSQKIIKWVVKTTAHFSFIRNIIRWILLGKSKLAIVDNSDSLHPSREVVELFSPLCYFMLNAPDELTGKPLPWGKGSCLFYPLPMMIHGSLIDKLGSMAGNTREYDLFITGVYHHPQRIKQREAAEILKARGRTVFELQERGFEKFSKMLSQSKLCMAGQGLGYHSIRMYEACSSGAVPVINLPETNIAHRFIHEDNAIVYASDASPEAIADAIEAALDGANLELIRQQSHNLVMNYHRSSALGDHVITSYLKTANS
jgi:hypothetical protein